MYFFVLGYYKPMAFTPSTDLPKTNEQPSQALKEQLSPNISDDVFITPDTPMSNDDKSHEDVGSKEESTTVTRQKSRNWADCIVDEPAAEITPPPTPELKPAYSMGNNNAADDFQVRPWYCIF